jgi:phosphate transport system protein
MTARKEFDQGLADMAHLLMSMGKHVGQALADAMETLKNSDVARAKEIRQADSALNGMEDQIREMATRLILTQQPVAKDLRRILAALRIASDLERMGDLAMGVARTTIRLNGEPLIKPLSDLPRMAEITSGMIDEAIRAFAEENVDLAHKMARDDDRVDELFAQVILELEFIMAKDPKTIRQSMQLIFVARYVERIADHATNIGESVIYLVTNHRPALN